MVLHYTPCIYLAQGLGAYSTSQSPAAVCNDQRSSFIVPSVQYLPYGTQTFLARVLYGTTIFFTSQQDFFVPLYGLFLLHPLVDFWSHTYDKYWRALTSNSLKSLSVIASSSACSNIFYTLLYLFYTWREGGGFLIW